MTAIIFMAHISNHGMKRIGRKVGLQAVEFILVAATGGNFCATYQ